MNSGASASLKATALAATTCMSGPPCTPGKTARSRSFAYCSRHMASPPRGPRGGMVMCQAKWAKDLDRVVFPGVQGGPLMHVIAAKAVAFREALTPDWRAYQRQIVANAKALADSLIRRGYRLVTGGTDTHLMLIDLTATGLTGKEAQESLDRAWITVNKNTIPFETRSPMVTSGIRVGTPAVTTRGMKEPEMDAIADFIDRVLRARGDQKAEASVRVDVASLAGRFPLYPERLA